MLRSFLSSKKSHANPHSETSLKGHEKRISCELSPFMVFISMDKVRKAIIPAAGLGTRFLPATKTVPKEMFPIVDTPILLYIIEEAAQAGIEDVIIVAGRNKTAIEDFFDTTYELEDKLAKNGQTDLLERVDKVRNQVNLISIRQREAKGLGHAVYTGHPIVGEEPFAVLLGDEIMKSTSPQESPTAQLTRSYVDTRLSTVSVMEVDKSQIHKYGVVEYSDKVGSALKISNVIEKPSAEEAPSSFALPGRYVFNAKIFSYLKNTAPGKNGEIQLTDGMTSLAKNEGLLALPISAQRYDAGDKLGYLTANIEFALDREDLGPSLKNYLQSLTSRL